MTYDAAVETQLALLASAGRLEVVNDFDTVFGKLEMGRAAGTLATPADLHPAPEDAPLQGAAVGDTDAGSDRPVSPASTCRRRPSVPAVRARYADAVKGMVADQVVPALYAKYFDDATVKRIFRQGVAPLLSALAVQD